MLSHTKRLIADRNFYNTMIISSSTLQSSVHCRSRSSIFSPWMFRMWPPHLTSSHRPLPSYSRRVWRWRRTLPAAAGPSLELQTNYRKRFHNQITEKAPSETKNLCYAITNPPTCLLRDCENFADGSFTALLCFLF